MLDANDHMVLDVCEAERVLICMYDKRNKEIKNGTTHFTQMGVSEQFIYHHGQIVYCSVKSIGDYYCYYINLSDCNNELGKITKQVGATMCGNLRHMFNVMGATVYDDLVMKHRDLSKFQYRYNLKDKINERITQYHHLHVRLRDIFKNSDSVVLTGDLAYLAAMLDCYNKIQATHVTFITYYMSLSDEHKNILVNLMLRYGRIRLDWLKLEGSVCKQMQGYAKYDLSKIFELQVLVNRLETEVDWVTEKEHRTNPSTVPMDYMDVYRAAVKLFDMAKHEGKKPLKMNWQDYWQQRSAVMPSGAVHSQYSDDVEIIKQLPLCLKNKKGLSSYLGYVNQNFFLQRKPEIHSYTSIKYEWGKVRALYGCDYTSHVNADFGLMQCEDTFPSFVPTGSNANEDYVRSQLNQIKTSVPFCFDYDDFNSQHSISSMAAVIDGWLTVYNDCLTDEQIAATMWTGRSIERMTVHNAITQEEYSATGTLFSGWRLTTFINTALNYIYLVKAGINDNVVKSVHNGDDVYAGLNNLACARNILKGAKVTGIRANHTKMSVGTIAEFLRMDMRANKPTSVQYLTRGIATFVHSRIESEAPLSLRAIVAAYKTRYDEIIARGADSKFAKRLYRKQLYFATKLFKCDKQLIDDLLEVDEVAGGMDKNGRIPSWRLEDTEVNGDNVDSYLSIISNGARDYTTYLKRKFPSIRRAVKYTNVARKLVNMYNVGYTSIKKVDASRSTMYHQRAMKHAWKHTKGMCVINKLRMGVGNILIAVTHINPVLADVLSKADDPVRWLAILT